MRKHMKSTEIHIGGHAYALRYFELATPRGTVRYSCEVVLGASDRIILDDDSMLSLESRVARLAPATVYSRLLAARSSVAA